MIKSTEKPLLAIVLFLLITGCNCDDSHGPLIGNINDDALNIDISMDKIQYGITKVFEPSHNDFIIKTARIIRQQEKYFLMIIGREEQKCMIPLEEVNGNLYEVNSNTIPIVICSGCEEGCEPTWTDEGWYCSDGCEHCEKSVSVSDHYIFE